MKRFRPVLALLGVIVVCVGVFIFRRPQMSTLRRINVLVGSSPVSVWSWNTLDKTFTVVALPAETVIDAVGGYGKYSLEALWKLGFIDKKDGLLLADSLSDALGISIPWYIGSKTHTLEAEDILSSGKKLFSLSHVVPFVFGRYETNMPPALFIAFIRGFSGSRPGAISLVDLTSVTHEEELPDNTTRNVLDTQLVDVALKGVFEDDRIRKEGISVGLYNTTQTPALGNRAARLLSSSGISVLFVGNAEKQVDECQLEGDKAALASLTASIIRELLDCRPVLSTDQKRTDLTVYIGVHFAKRYASGLSSVDSAGSLSSPVGVVSGASMAVGEDEPPLAKGM